MLTHKNKEEFCNKKMEDEEHVKVDFILGEYHRF
jgi:hypothetical protein